MLGSEATELMMWVANGVRGAAGEAIEKVAVDTLVDACKGLTGEAAKAAAKATSPWAFVSSDTQRGLSHT